MKFDIVLIDDHSLVLEGLKTLLRDIAGVNSVCTVTNGTELLSLIKSRIFHIYITDLSNLREPRRYVKRCVPLWWMKTIIVSVINSYIKRKAGRTMKPSCRICCLLRVSWMY